MALSLNSGFSSQPLAFQANALGPPKSGQVQPPAEQARVQSLFNQYSHNAGNAQTLAFGDALAKVKRDNYAHILGHEQAHASAAGSLGGGIHIEYDGNGVAVAGHVPISIPGLSFQDPEGNLRDYGRVRAAALAPGDPSGADLSIASRASALMGQAQVLMAQKKMAGQLGLTPLAFQGLGRPKNALELAARRGEKPPAANNPQRAASPFVLSPPTQQV